MSSVVSGGMWKSGGADARQQKQRLVQLLGIQRACCLQHQLVDIFNAVTGHMLVQGQLLLF